MVDDHCFGRVIRWLCSLVCGYLGGEPKDESVTFFQDGHGIFFLNNMCPIGYMKHSNPQLGPSNVGVLFRFFLVL